MEAIQGKMLYQDDAPEPFLTVPRFQAAIQERFRNCSKYFLIVPKNI